MEGINEYMFKKQAFKSWFYQDFPVGFVLGLRPRFSNTFFYVIENFD